MRFDFIQLPEDRSGLARPVVPVVVDGIEDAPQLCLVDTGSTTNRFGSWIAEAAGLDIRGAPEDTIAVAGITCRARHARLGLRIGDVGFEAPITFCDPWPFAFNLLGQEGFLRFFRLTVCAAEFWLELEPERVY